MRVRRRPSREGLGAGLSPEPGDEPGTVKPEVLSNLYDEVGEALNRQFEQIDGLNERAQQLLGFAAVILTIIAAVVPKDLPPWERAAFIATIAFFAPTAWYGARAWLLASWRGDPDVHVLWREYRRSDEETFRYQVIQNRLDSIRDNEQRIEAKVKAVRVAHRWLNGGFVYIAALVVIHLAG